MTNQVDLSRLQSQLLTSGIQQSNNALYQVITQLLAAIQQIQSTSSKVVTSSGPVTVSSTIFLPGIDGLDGNIGFPGIQGLIGPNGISGPPGLDGIDGDPGFFGLINQFQGWTVIDSTATGTQDNWDPGLNGNTLITWHGASDVTVSGFANGYKGQIVALKDTGTKIATFSHNSGSSTQKLFNYATSAGTSIAANGNIAYQYDGTQWQIINHEQGTWITQTYSAGDYTASGSMTWTVDSSDIGTFAYLLIGRTLTIQVAINNSTIGGTPGVALQIASPGGFTITARAQNGLIGLQLWSENAGTNRAFGIILPTTNLLVLYKTPITNYNTNTNQTEINFVTSVEVS